MPTYTRRPARVMPWSRADRSPLGSSKLAPHAHADDQPGPGQPVGIPTAAEPDWLLDLKDEVSRSVFAIERVAGRVATMHDDTNYFRSAAVDLRRELELERADTGRRLAEHGRAMSKQQRRTEAAEACADSLAGMLLDLERQLSTCRTHTERLVDAVDHVVAGEADRADLYRWQG